MTIEILPDRLKRFKRKTVHLVKGTGAGVNGKVELCVMQAANWLAGDDGKDDDHPCVDRGIRSFLIRLNDSALFAEYRDELKPYAVRVLGTAGDDALLRKRAYMCADWAVRTMAPMWFDIWAKNVPKKAEFANELAAKLRAVPEIIDAKTAREGRSVAQDVRSAGSAAYAAADAASAADAAYAASAKRPLWDESLRFLDRLIAVGSEVAA